MRLLTLLAKDARLLTRNRALLAALLAYPFLLALVLGAAFSEPPTTLDLAIMNGDEDGEALDAGGVSVTSADLVKAAGSFARVRTVGSEEEALAAVRRGDVDAALIIPYGFVGDLARLGSHATLRIIVDDSDPTRASVARNAVAGGVEEFVKRVIARKIADVQTLLNVTIEGGTTRILVDVDVLGIDASIARLDEINAKLANGSDDKRKVTEVIAFLRFSRGILASSENFLTTTAIPVDIQTSTLSGKNTRLVAIALPGAIVLGLFWTGGLASALLITRERETGVARRLAAAPGARTQQALSKLLIALLAALLPALILLGIGILTLGALIRDPLLAAATLILASLAAAALGSLAAGLARATSSAALLTVLLLLPMLLLGGLFYPVAYMPPAAQIVASTLPVTLATDALRGSLLRGSAAAELALALAGLAIFALVAGSAGAWLGRRGR